MTSLGQSKSNVPGHHMTSLGQSKISGHHMTSLQQNKNK